MAWNFTVDKPIYAQITQILKRNILSGKYDLGSKLPSVRELAAEAAVNPNTMQKAFTELEQDGLISTQRNSGRIVTTDQAIIDTARNFMLEDMTKNYLRKLREMGSTVTDAIQLIEKFEKEI